MGSMLIFSLEICAESVVNIDKSMKINWSNIDLQK